MKYSLNVILLTIGINFGAIASTLWVDDSRNLIPSFTNYGFDNGTFNQWSIYNLYTPWSLEIRNDPNAEGGKAMFFEEWAAGLKVVSPNFVATAGSYYEARFYNPGGISSCTAIVVAGASPDDPVSGSGDWFWPYLVQVGGYNSSDYVTRTIDLTPFAGQTIRVGFAGGNLQADYAKVFVPEPSALSLLAVGLGVVLRRRRRAV